MTRGAPCSTRPQGAARLRVAVDRSILAGTGDAAHDARQAARRGVTGEAACFPRKFKSAAAWQVGAEAGRLDHPPDGQPAETGGGDGKEKFDHTRFVLERIKAAEELVDTYGHG